MSATTRRVTRGDGFLEEFLARQRSRQANSLIPESARNGRVLDIGCGSHPLFLLTTRFAERYGLDRVPSNDFKEQGITLINHDIETKLTRLEIYNGKDEGWQHDEDEARLLEQLEGHPGTQD